MRVWVLFGVVLRPERSLMSHIQVARNLYFDRKLWKTKWGRQYKQYMTKSIFRRKIAKHKRSSINQQFAFYNPPHEACQDISLEVLFKISGIYNNWGQDIVIKQTLRIVVSWLRENEGEVILGHRPALILICSHLTTCPPESPLLIRTVDEHLKSGIVERVRELNEPIAKRNRRR